MSTRAQKNRRAKKSRYLLLAALGLLSLIAYTMNNNASKSSGFDQIAQPSQLKSKAHQPQDVMAPFTQRWQQAQTDIENYLMDDGFKKTRYFFDGYNVASNDEFVLPTEETGAGNGTDQHIQDLSDAIVADLVPTGYSAGGPSTSGGGVGGVGGGAGSGRDKTPPPYVIGDLEEGDNKGGTNEGGGANGDVSAVPVPPAIWLLSSALIGLMGLRRKQVH